MTIQNDQRTYAEEDPQVSAINCQITLKTIEDNTELLCEEKKVEDKYDKYSLDERLNQFSKHVHDQVLKSFFKMKWSKEFSTDEFISLEMNTESIIKQFLMTTKYCSESRLIFSPEI